MSEKESAMEFHGTTVDEAIEKGLKTLGISRLEAEIEVLEEGSKGLFGLGSKEAAVRISTRKSDGPVEAEAPEADEIFEADVEEKMGFEPEEAYEDEDDYSDDEISGDDEIVAITRETVIELLSKMHVGADVSAKMMPEDDHSNRKAVSVDISGDDLSILIGRKAETLDALQYITRLIVGKELSSSVIINIDVQGYKSRLEQRLRRIAKSVARQAVETGRRQYLEPMSAADRRIVHMTLRDDPNVYTESVGEGYRRKVTINPKS